MDRKSRRDFEVLVCSVEEACLAARGLSNQELALLDSLRASQPGNGASYEEMHLLRGFAQRLWCACSSDGAMSLGGATEAKIRQLACMLFSSGSLGDVPELQAAQWALAGRAWAQAGDHREALHCFNAVTSRPATKAELEASTQAHIWASAVHYSLGDHNKAFESLAQARDSIGVSDLGLALLQELCQACFEQARSHRQAGRAALAIELLTLALAAIPSDGGNESHQDIKTETELEIEAFQKPYRVRLLRQLALCYAAKAAAAGVKGCPVALDHAREAVTLGPPASLEVAASLQILLELLLADHREAEDLDDMTEVLSVARRLMGEPAAAFEDCLRWCSSLYQRKLPESLVFELVGILEKRQDESFDQVEGQELRAKRKKELQRFKLALASRAALAVLSEGPHSAAQPAAHGRLDKALAAVAVEEQAQTLRGLGAAAEATGCYGAAAAWLRRAAELETQIAAGMSSVAADAADCWAAAGACFRRDNLHDAANTCAKEALRLIPEHLQANLLGLVAFAEAGEIPEARAILERMKRGAVQGLRAEHVAVVSQTLQVQLHAKASKETGPTLDHEDLAFSALELLAATMAKAPQVSATLGLRVVALLLEQAKLRKRSDDDILRYLGFAVELLTSSRNHATGENEAETLGIAEAAWCYGQQKGLECRWLQSAEAFQMTHRLLELLDKEDSKDISERRAWCLALMASAQLQRAKEIPGRPSERSDLLESAIQALGKAHQLFRLGFAHAGMSEHGKVSGNIFLVLVLLEFEVRCLLGNPELQLKRFVDEASAQEAVGAKSLLAMSKLAATSSRRLAIHCLQRYIRVFVGSGGTADYSQCAPAYREMIVLQSSRNESFAVFEGILHLLNGSAAASLPEAELNWLVATAWNNGAHFVRLQQYSWGDRWLSKSLELAKFCPGSFDEALMQSKHKECIKLCRGFDAPKTPTATTGEQNQAH